MSGKYISEWQLEGSVDCFYIDVDDRVTPDRDKAKSFDTESEAEDHAVEWAYTSSPFSVGSAGYSIERF